MSVFQCNNCEVAPCTLLIMDPDCACPDKCPWMNNGNEPVWRELKGVD